MRVLVCGGRQYADWQRFNALLDSIHRQNGITCVIQGGATGADWLARTWAVDNGVECQSYPAGWDNLDLPEWKLKVKYNQYGKPYNALAGFNRNQEMIEFGVPELTIAFPGGEGTYDMCLRSVTAKIPTLRLNLADETDLINDEEAEPPPPIEWLLRPDPNAPKRPRRAEPTPEGRYESQF